jgi:glycosyltransferase involved in cell wall biosynthesis
MGQSISDKQIGYLLRSYPRLSQTFILNEILALEKIGVSIQIFAMVNPHEKVIQMQVDQIQAPVQYLDTVQTRAFWGAVKEHVEVATRHPRGYLRSLFYVAGNPSIDKGYTASNRWSCFIQSVKLVRLILKDPLPGRKIDHLHAHFAHDPALVAYLVHCIAGITFSFTAHARDLYQVDKKVLMDRIRQATAVITCCRANMEYLNQIVPSQRSKLLLIYHGVNLREFQPVSNPRTYSVSTDRLILSVGRLVEKKGFQELFEALLLVKKRGERFHCVIYGDGPLREKLEDWIDGHGMNNEILLCGDRTQQELIGIFQSATLFILTPVRTEDGDRDGIPNVLLEAMAAGLPIVTTAVAGIPELVDHDQNGLLYQPHDVEGISSGIIELLHNVKKRELLGRAASRKVRKQFDITQSAQTLKSFFVQSHV